MISTRRRAQIIHEIVGFEHFLIHARALLALFCLLNVKYFFELFISELNLAIFVYYQNALGHAL
jgi:hypothetical protein